MDHLDYILRERDSIEYSGDLFYKYFNELETLSYQADFIQIINNRLEHAISTQNIKRAEFIIFLLVALGNDSPDYRHIYINIADFILMLFEGKDESGNDKENILEIALDLFWHQDNGLRELDSNQQNKLRKLIELSATYKYEMSENGDAIFFAINKSMDLIKFQEPGGNTQYLVGLYLNHFDDRVRERALRHK